MHYPQGQRAFYPVGLWINFRTVLYEKKPHLHGHLYPLYLFGSVVFGDLIHIEFAAGNPTKESVKAVCHSGNGASVFVFPGAFLGKISTSHRTNAYMRAEKNPSYQN